jgi:proteasome alpha subunit
VVVQYVDGVLFVAENPSRALHKVSEIYDRIAFAAVGKYNEFENLRVAGVRLADLRGYSYDRRDVTGRALANAYAQTLGTIFTDAPKPYEVELVVAEVGVSSATDQLYRLTFDGSVADEHGFVAMGGLAEEITAGMADRYREGMSLEDALTLAVDLLAGSDEDRRELTAAQLEVAVLDRNRPRRAFQRINGSRLVGLLGEAAAGEQAPDQDADDAARRASSPTQSDADQGEDSGAGESTENR